MACTTPKSPHPGHQIGLRSLLKSLAVSGQREVIGSFLWLASVACLPLQRERYVPQGRRDLGRAERIRAGAAERLDAGGNVGEHLQETVELALVRLLDDEAALHRGEEAPVHAVRDRIEEPRHEQLDGEAVGAREP